MSLDSDNYQRLLSIIRDKYNEVPSMETCSSLEYMINEAFLDGDITISESHQLKAELGELTRPRHSILVDDVRATMRMRIANARYQQARKFREEKERLRKEEIKKQRAKMNIEKALYHLEDN